MSTGLVIGIVVAVVLAVVIFAMTRRKQGLALPQAETPKPAPPPAIEPVAQAAVTVPDLETAPAERQPGTPEPAAAPGVRLDEKEESDAAERLEEERRDHRIKRLREGLSNTRGGLIAKITSIFKGKKHIDPGLLEQLEETLISSDVGAQTTAWLVKVLKDALDKNELADVEAVWSLLKEEIRQILSVDAKPIEPKAHQPHTIMVVGVNGVGKTTTIGKLASKYTEQGLKVVLAAGDTFRAAAVNQLEIWGRRAGAEVVKSKEGSDPSSVVFEAIKRAKEIGADVVIADTAGRLHTKVPLMEELKKVARVMAKAQDGAPHQILLVLDATTGQNANQQVALFKEILDLSGLVITKLDGTAKGGVVIGICHEHKVPVRLIGIGEAKEDLRDFEVNDFVDALFLRDENTAERGAQTLHDTVSFGSGVSIVILDI